jgi:hypothetical protein
MGGPEVRMIVLSTDNLVVYDNKGNGLVFYSPLAR